MYYINFFLFQKNFSKKVLIYPISLINKRIMNNICLLEINVQYVSYINHTDKKKTKF